MKRPAFQFYTADWQGNSKLRRCSHIHKGVWVDVMCLMHDSDEYGVLRWPLEDIAQAVGCSIRLLRELVSKGVLKGAELGQRIEAFIYTPRHAGKDGVPVTLLPEQEGPIWYSSRMVRDEYVRSKRGEGTRFGDEPKPTPNPTIGDEPTQREGCGPSTSSSTSSSKDQKHVGNAPNGARHADDSPILITLPLREGGEFEVRQSLVAEVEPLCPAVDVPATLKEMKLWLVGNPDRRKTRKGVKRFITNWLKTEQDKHGS